jgi:Tfp pilus assembly protein PilO
MPRNSNARDSKFIVRVLLGVLLVANIVAAAFVMYPPGGSADDLERELANLQSQAAAKRALLASTRQHVAAVEQGRKEGDEFLSQYFLSRRTAYSTLLTELVDAAGRAKIKPKEHAYSTEPIEGSDTLSMMSISANYEGTYANLMRFVSELDRSPRLLIIEGLNAAPQQNGGPLNITLKIDTFVREDGDLTAANVGGQQ